jgi:AcrR family transcriptional regulator
MSVTVIIVAQLMSVTVITYDRVMGRWEPDAQGRLAQAAWALFAERGFDQTTVAEIAARAGLTERTFFRHFADKREVLFFGSELAKDRLVTAVAGAPDSAGPMEAIGAALQSVGAMIAQDPERVMLRQSIISANADLQERELIKLAAWAATLAAALRDRNLPEPDASLAGEAGMAVFKVAFMSWITDPAALNLPEIIGEYVKQLARVLS